MDSSFRWNDVTDVAMRHSYVYIMSNKFRGTLYIGVTSDLIRRVYEHQEGLVEGFTKTYKLHMLVYYEIHEDISVAIQRESQMKAWRRAWKMEFFEKTNPYWKDLYDSLF